MHDGIGWQCTLHHNSFRFRFDIIKYCLRGFFYSASLTFFSNNIEDRLYKILYFLIWFSNLIFEDLVIILDHLIFIFL